jgi:hypothetical protein
LSRFAHKTPENRLSGDFLPCKLQAKKFTGATGLGFAVTVFASAVKYRFKKINLKMVFILKVFRNFIKKIALQVCKFSAFFTFQVKMFFPRLVRRHILIAGAFTIVGNVFIDSSGLRQFFQMAVDRGQAYGFPGFMPEVIGYIVNRNMEIPPGSQVINDKPSLPGIVPGTDPCLSTLFRTPHSFPPIDG